MTFDAEPFLRQMEEEGIIPPRKIMSEENTQPNNADIIPLSNIVAGLLASGHFTNNVEYPDEDFLKRYDFGDSWSEDHKGSSLIYRRHVPEVLLEAVELYRAVKNYCTLG
jgi:hypothetical protein